MVTIAGCGIAAIALMVSACSKGGGPSTGGTKVQGGTAVYALPPSTTPNYIFPMANDTYFNVANVAHLQYFLYRPLYWFGNGNQPTLNDSLSLANEPQYDGKQVTITMKNYKWSNGTPVTAQNVLFWIHMLQAMGRPAGAPSPRPDSRPTSPVSRRPVPRRSP